MNQRPHHHGLILPLLLLALIPIASTGAEAAALRLVPFPKEVTVSSGTLRLDGWILEAAAADLPVVARLIREELQRAGTAAPTASSLEGPAHRVRIHLPDAVPPAPPSMRDQAGDEDYTLAIGPGGAAIDGTSARSVIHGVQTLCQLIRANRTGNQIPCLAIRDYPALRLRGFQNDMTRGPSSSLATLTGQVDLCSSLKLNFFSYYMEHQFAYAKHPGIGPVDGSMTPEDLSALVAHAAPLQVDILGCQQSFGHMNGVLALDQFKHLAEHTNERRGPMDRWALTPALEETYQLLDDLYSEQCPRLPFGIFNINCDEVGTLGIGPAKEMVASIGSTGAYIKHITRLHALLRDRHGKRTAMWGDFLQHHPEAIGQFPKDIMILDWDYAPRDDYSDRIRPLIAGGHEVMVCPSVIDYNRLLPDFAGSAINIRNFVRDGVRLGAAGMFNTEWKDGGEALNAPTWYGAAWGAECAWSGSTTAQEDFDRRIGAILFGEPVARFGQAIQALSKIRNIPGIAEDGVYNKRFWRSDAIPGMDPAAACREAQRLLDLVRPALDHLQACRNAATRNTEVLDAVIFGARRMEFLGQRILHADEATRLYLQACSDPAGPASPALGSAITLLRGDRATLAGLRQEHIRLWNLESRPYSLDRITKRYDEALAEADRRLAQLTALAEGSAALPPPGQIGLGAAAAGRRTWADRTDDRPLAPDTPWEDPSASHRCGFTVAAGPVERRALPVEQDLRLPPDLAARPVRAFAQIAGKTDEIPAQLGPAPEGPWSRLTVLIPGPIPAKAQAVVRVYLGLTGSPAVLPTAVSTSQAADGLAVVENDRIRIRIDPVGGRITGWELRAGDQPMLRTGTGAAVGCSDLGTELRAARNPLICTASGPALVRYRWTNPSGVGKQISLYAGASWVEEFTLADGLASGWTGTPAPSRFQAGSTRYMASEGQQGPMDRIVIVKGRWGVMTTDGNLAIGLVAPGVNRTEFVLGPGRISANRAVPRQLITFAGVLDASAADTMDRLERSLSFVRQPEVTRFAVEARPR
jgi:hypothetical protein